MGTTLITGLGLVGTSYAQHALKRGESVVFYDVAPRKDFLAHKLGSANVTVVQRDVRDLPSLIETIQKYKCDTVIHTAGLIGGKVANPIYTGLQINVMGTINVAEAVRLTGVKRLVQISTFGIYDRRQGEPTPIDENFRRGPGEAYGNSKVAKELMVEAYQRMFGFELIVLRLANVYGVGHFAGGSGGGEMVQNMLQTGIKGGVVKIAQEVARDFEYVYYKDLGRALDKAATTPLKEPVTLNIGTGVVIKFDDLVGLGGETTAEAASRNHPRPTAALGETADGDREGQASARLGAGIRYRSGLQRLHRRTESAGLIGKRFTAETLRMHEGQSFLSSKYSELCVSVPLW